MGTIYLLSSFYIISNAIRTGLFRKRGCNKAQRCTRQSRKVFLTLRLSNKLLSFLLLLTNILASCVVFSDLPQRLKSSNRELKTTHNTFQDHRVLYSDNNSRDSRIWHVIIFAAVACPFACFVETHTVSRSKKYIISSMGWVIPYKREIWRASLLQVKFIAW